MKRLLAGILCFAILLAGCGNVPEEQEIVVNDNGNEMLQEDFEWYDLEIQYNSLDEEELLEYIEDLVYRDTIKSLNSTEYVVESVNSVYISKEYLEEVAFNSQSNIFFGYTLDELDSLFQGTRYVFTIGEDGRTKVEELQEIEDTLTEDMLKNIAIGAGVILICVTVSAVSGGLGAPAVSMIFAASAKTGMAMATSSALFGGISAGVVEGIRTGDFSEAVEAATLAGSEGFKWGAITGAISGGTKETFILKNATKKGLTMNEAALIQKESLLPMDVIAELHSYDEYLVYKNAGLRPVMVNGKTALMQKIDLNYVSKLPDGSEVTNLVRMQKGYAPIDPITKKAYQLHHIGQNANGTLAVLTEEQHLGNSAILNIAGKDSEIVRKEFDIVRKNFWTYVGNAFAGGQ